MFKGNTKRLNSHKAKEVSIVLTSFVFIILTSADYYINSKLDIALGNKTAICSIINVIIAICIFFITILFMGFMYYKVFNGKELEKLDFIISLENGKLIPISFKQVSGKVYFSINNINENINEFLDQDGYNFYVQVLENNNIYIVICDENDQEVYRKIVDDFEEFKISFTLQNNN